MRFSTLIFRSLRFHWRSHLGVLLGAAVGSAALIGALVVGDSVRESLRELALQRLGDIAFAVAPHDRFFRDALWHSVQYAPLLAAASAAPAGTNVAAPAGLSTRPNQSTAP